MTDSNRLAPTLTGRQVRLRPMCRADLIRELKWMNDPRVARWMEANYPIHYNIDDLESIFWGALRGEECILIIENLARNPVGDVWLHPVDFRHRRGVVTVQLGEVEWWGKGLAAEALGLLVNHAFVTLGLHRLEAEVMAPNDRAKHLFHTAGFVVEGRQRDRVYRDGTYMDVLLLGLLASDHSRKEASL